MKVIPLLKWYKRLLETKTEVWRHIWIFGPDPTPCLGAAEVPRRSWAQLGNSVGNKLQKWANNVKKCYFTITIANLPWLRMRGAAPLLMSASMSPYSSVTGTSAGQAITLLSWSLSCQDYSAAITSSSPSLRHVGHVWQWMFDNIAMRRHFFLQIDKNIVSAQNYATYLHCNTPTDL